MAIYTSRYSNKKLQEGGFYPVGISVGTPRFPLGYLLRDKCYALAPTRDMLSMEYEPYRLRYMNNLNRIGAGKIIGIINKLEMKANEEGKVLVLLCYEDIRNGEDWCHRTLFAEWWMNHTGEVIEELEDPSPVKLPKKKPVKEEIPAKAQSEKVDKKAQEESKAEEFTQMRMY